MNNVIRKEIRKIIEQLEQLEKACKEIKEKDAIQAARVCLVQADYYDFHINPKKKYKEPKTNFKYNECKHL